jgi:hypothetical protein
MTGISGRSNEPYKWNRLKSKMRFITFAALAPTSDLDLISFLNLPMHLSSDIELSAGSGPHALIIKPEWRAMCHVDFKTERESRLAPISLLIKVNQDSINLKNEELVK